MQTTFQAVVVASEKRYNKGGGDATVDVNGNYPIQFTIVAGKLPARALVISGTIAQSLGFDAGNTYVTQASFRDTNEYGDNWNHVKLGQLSAIDMAKLPDFIKAFGKPQVVSVDTKVEVEEEVGADNGI